MTNLENQDMVTELCEERLLEIPGFLSKDECLRLIKESETRGFKKSAPSGGGHGRTGREGARTSWFSVTHDQQFVDGIWKKVERYLPDDLSFLKQNTYFDSKTNGKEWKTAFVHDKLRVYKYEVGDSFPEHYDYKIKRESEDDEGAFTDQSFLTLLVYLNDDFKGGETGYWMNDEGIHCRFMRNENKANGGKEHQRVIIPVTGKAIVQDQNILHEGMPPTQGTKYILRMDIIHRKRVALPPGVTRDKKNGKWDELFESGCKNYAD